MVKSEQEQWEEDQLKMANQFKFGVNQNNEDDGYDYVFEDQIDFISHEIMKGTKKKDGEGSEDEDEEEEDDNDNDDDEENVENIKLTPHEKILLGRRKLPVYAYRDEFLEAMQNNKVLIK